MVDDGRTTDGRTTEHGYTISSPCEPDGSGELINGPGHMTKMATMPIYGKNHKKNLLLLYRWTDFNETCYVASGTLAHHSLYKL